jgi:hypothetical protein
MEVQEAGKTALTPKFVVLYEDLLAGVISAM